MKRRVARAVLVVALLLGMPGLAALATAQTKTRATAQTKTIDWGAVLRALGIALDSWRLSPFPRPTATAVPAPPTSTATITLTPSRTRTSTRTPSFTRTPPPTLTATATGTSTRTASVTRTPTETRTPTATRAPTDTPTPRPTATPIPTVSNDGQIAFAAAEGLPPEQGLASALIVFPYVVTSSTQDTRIELMNMSDAPLQLQCFYVRQSDCVEVGFFVSLTAQQPLSWLANDGANNPLTFSAVPPFDGVGELKCAVVTILPDLRFHNVLQGRALVFDRFSGETVGYGAVGFQRLSPGPYSGVIDLDGFTYEACPDRLHFQVFTRSSAPTSELVVVPCAEDLLTQTPTETVVQLAIVNEFEQVFSSSFRFSCLTSQSFSRFTTLSKSVLGTETAHVVARGVSSPLIAMVIDRFGGQNNTLHTTANEPFPEGGRSATVILP